MGVVLAVLLHVGFLAFGGVIFGKKEEGAAKPRSVELVSDEPTAAEKEKKPEEKTDETKEEMETETEAAPDAEEIIRNMDVSAATEAPALEAASLSAIEAALSGQGAGGGDFGDALSFASGGKIGGTGRAGALEEKMESAFSMAEIDQKPRPVFQAAPQFPAEMRGKKTEGVVSLLCLVDDQGRVTKPKVEKSSHPAFEKPAFDAVKKWKFEPAVKGGKRVGCPVRLTIRFLPN